MPYFVNIIPLIAGLNYERFPNKNISKVFYFTIIFLLTFLMNVHSGVVLILSFLTGVYIKGKKIIFKYTLYFPIINTMHSNTVNDEIIHFLCQRRKLRTSDGACHHACALLPKNTRCWEKDPYIWREQL